MKIAFGKVGRSPAEFRYTEEGLTIAGTLLKEEHHQVALNAEISGEVKLFCDRCGEAYSEAIRLPLALTLTDRAQKHSDNLDIIEFLSGEIDVAALLESEISSYRSSYHYCPKCAEDDSGIDIEY